MKLNQVNQKRKGHLFLVTLCLTSVFLLLCGGDSDTNGDPDTNDGTGMYDYICNNGVKATGTTTTQDTQKCSSCSSGFALDNEMCVKLTVSLSLACSDGYEDDNGVCTAGEAIEITNTIKDANLPIYTVTRTVSTSDSLTVTLKWVITASDASSALTKYLKDPKISSYSFGSNTPACTKYVPTGGYYTFKFLGDSTDPTRTPAVMVAAKTITVTIPASHSSFSFRLDPFRCPDLASIGVGNEARQGADADVSIKIMTASDNGVMVDTTTKALKIKYENLSSNCTGDTRQNDFACAGSTR